MFFFGFSFLKKLTNHRKAPSGMVGNRNPEQMERERLEEGSLEKKLDIFHNLKPRQKAEWIREARKKVSEQW